MVMAVSHAEPELWNVVATSISPFCKLTYLQKTVAPTEEQIIFSCDAMVVQHIVKVIEIQCFIESH